MTTWFIGLLLLINFALAGVVNSLWIKLRAARMVSDRLLGERDRLREQRNRLLEERGRLLEAQTAAFRESMDRVNNS